MKTWSELSSKQQEGLIKLSRLGLVFSDSCFEALISNDLLKSELIDSLWIQRGDAYLEFSTREQHAQAQEAALTQDLEVESFWHLIDLIMLKSITKDTNLLDLQGVNLAFNELYKLKDELDAALDFTPERVLYSAEAAWLLGRSVSGPESSKSLFSNESYASTLLQSALTRLNVPSTPKETWLYGWILWDLGRSYLRSQDSFSLDVESEGARSIGVAMLQVGMEEVLGISDVEPQELRDTKNLLQLSGMELEAQKIFGEIFESSSRESVGGVLAELYLEQGQPVQALNILDVCTPDDFDALKVEAYTQLGDLRLAGDYAINAARKASPEAGALWAIRGSELYRNSDSLEDAENALKVLQVQDFSPSLRLLFSAEDARLALLNARELSSANQLFSDQLESEVENENDVDLKTFLYVARGEYLAKTSRVQEALDLLLEASLGGLNSWEETLEVASGLRDWRVIELISTKAHADPDTSVLARNLLYANAGDIESLKAAISKRPETLKDSVSILLENGECEKAITLWREFKTGFPAMLVELLLAKGFKGEARSEIVSFLGEGEPTPLRSQAAGVLLLKALEEDFSEKEADALGRALKVSSRIKGCEDFWGKGLRKLKGSPFQGIYQSALSTLKEEPNTCILALEIEEG